MLASARRVGSRNVTLIDLDYHSYFQYKLGLSYPDTLYITRRWSLFSAFALSAEWN